MMILAAWAINPTGVDWVDRVLIFAGLLAAVGMIWRQGVRPLSRFFRRVAEGVEFVSDQMRPNGGGSMRDTLDRMETRQVNVEGVQAALADRLARVESKLDQHMKEKS